MLFKTLSIGALYLVLVLIGQFYFKKAAGSLNTDSTMSFLQTLFGNWQIWLAVATYFTAMMSWVWLLKYIDLSRVFPIMSAVLLLVIPLMSSHLLSETLSIRYWLGVSCMLIGIALIATEIPAS